MSRPRIEEDFAQEVYTIRLSPRLARVARRLGGTNLSAGVRKAIEICAEVERRALEKSIAIAEEIY